MDHSYIDEHNIVARYGMGKLSSEECARFEEHFVDCPTCLEQLETTHDLKQALKTLAAHNATRFEFAGTPVSSPRVVSIWKPALIAVAACLILFAVPASVLIRQARLAQAEVNQAKAAAESWHGQYTQEQQASAELQRQLHDLAQEGQQNRSVAGVVAALPMAADIFQLETVRGGEPAGAEPVNRVLISRSLPSVTLSIDRSELESARSFHATLADSHGHILWHLANLEPVSSNLGVTIPASLLHAGDYVLTLQGRSGQGGGIVSRAYPFRVKFKP